MLFWKFYVSDIFLSSVPTLHMWSNLPFILLNGSCIHSLFPSYIMEKEIYWKRNILNELQTWTFIFLSMIIKFYIFSKFCSGTLVSFLNLGNKLSPATTQRKSLAKQLFLTSGNPTAVKKKPTTLRYYRIVAK